MNLSNRATEYLKSLKRDFKWTSNLEETKAYLERQGNTPFEEYLRFQIIPECSDQYTTWWKNDHLIAVKGIWLDRHDAYFHAYGTDRNSCDQLIERLKTNKILK